MSQAIPHVFLFVSRLKGKQNSSDDDLKLLIDDEFNEMVKKLDPYLTDEKKREINNLLKNSNTIFNYLLKTSYMPV